MNSAPHTIALRCRPCCMYSYSVHKSAFVFCVCPARKLLIPRHIIWIIELMFQPRTRGYEYAMHAQAGHRIFSPHWFCPAGPSVFHSKHWAHRHKHTWTHWLGKIGWDFRQSTHMLFIRRKSCDAYSGHTGIHQHRMCDNGITDEHFWNINFNHWINNNDIDCNATVCLATYVVGTRHVAIIISLVRRFVSRGRRRSYEWTKSNCIHISDGDEGLFLFYFIFPSKWHNWIVILCELMDAIAVHNWMIISVCVRCVCTAHRQRVWVWALSSFDINIHLSSLLTNVAGAGAIDWLSVPAAIFITIVPHSYANSGIRLKNSYTYL